jgi:hypothetical protein
MYLHHANDTRTYAAEESKVYAHALHAYCLGLLACVKLVYTEMVKGNVYEDEDFSLGLYGVDWLVSVHPASALVLLEGAMEEVHESVLSVWLQQRYASLRV